MIGSILVVSALALQGAAASKPSAKPAAPIAVAADAGPTVEVPAELAALTGKDTIAVIYLPDAEGADKVTARLVDALGPIGGGMPLGTSMKQLLRQGVRTEMDIPLNQPVLWWIDLPATGGDEPPMGMGEVVFRQAMRIPGAEAAMEKARVEVAKGADPKAKPAYPIRAKGRRSSVSVLKGDLVVVSSDMEPFQAPDKPQPSALLKSLPLSAVCGRVDLSRVMAEQGDQLRMMGGFAGAALAGGMDGGAADDKLTDAEKRQRAMKQQLADAVGKQIDATVDALMQLKRATFAASLQGDDFGVWADWSRETAFPKGISGPAVEGLCAALPAGMNAYFGISTNAMLTMYGDRVQIDDALATLGATPEQKKAYEDAMAKARTAMDMVVDGAVGAIGGLEKGVDGVAAVVAFKVKDASAFRTTLKGAMDDMGRSGMAQVAVTDQGELMTVTITPSAVRMQDLLTAFGQPDVAAEAVQQATTPSTLAMRFKGNEVLITQGRGDKAVDPAALVKAGATDLRGSLAAKAWGTADWFGVIELRSIVGGGMNSAGLKDPKLVAAAADFAKGKPMLIRLWQGVQGNTARLSVDLSLADLKQFVVDMETVRKAAVPAAGGDDDDDDDDDKDEKGGDEGT